MNLISGSLLLLARQLDAQRALRADEGLDRTATEELLRLISPVQLTGRSLTSDVEIDGHVLEKGSFVFILIGAANRDPRSFESPTSLVLSRERNPHLGFGFGLPLLGAPLARLESSVVLREVLKATSVIELAQDTVRCRPTSSCVASRSCSSAFTDRPTRPDLQQCQGSRRPGAVEAPSLARRAGELLRYAPHRQKGALGDEVLRSQPHSRVERATLGALVTIAVTFGVLVTGPAARAGASLATCKSSGLLVRDRWLQRDDDERQLGRQVLRGRHEGWHRHALLTTAPVRPAWMHARTAFPTRVTRGGTPTSGASRWPPTPTRRPRSARSRGSAAAPWATWRTWPRSTGRITPSSWWRTTTRGCQRLHQQRLGAGVVGQRLHPLARSRRRAGQEVIRPSRRPRAQRLALVASPSPKGS